MRWWDFVTRNTQNNYLFKKKLSLKEKIYDSEAV